MAGVRRGATAILRFYIPLYVVAVIVQIFLAGEGIFGIKKGVKLDDQKTLDPHRGLGFFLTIPGALLMLILALLAWHPDRRIRRATIALPFILFGQNLLANAGRWGGAFHPLLAFVILGMLGWLAGMFWGAHGARATRREETTSVPTG